jgi:hypothetical protein
MRRIDGFRSGHTDRDRQVRRVLTAATEHTVVPSSVVRDGAIRGAMLLNVPYHDVHTALL